MQASGTGFTVQPEYRALSETVLDYSAPIFLKAFVEIIGFNEWITARVQNTLHKKSTWKWKQMRHCITIHKKRPLMSLYTQYRKWGDTREVHMPFNDIPFPSVHCQISLPPIQKKHVDKKRGFVMGELLHFFLWMTLKPEPSAQLSENSM